MKMTMTKSMMVFMAACSVLAPVANAALYEPSTEQDADASAPSIDQHHRELLKQKKIIAVRQQDCDRLAIDGDDEEFRQLEEIHEDGARNLSYIRSPNTVQEAFAEAMDRGGYGVAGAGSGISHWGKKGSSSSSDDEYGSKKGGYYDDDGHGKKSSSSGKKGGDDDDDDSGKKGSHSGGKKGGDDDDDDHPPTASPVSNSIAETLPVSTMKLMTFDLQLP